jgi:hypothetical protein
MTKCPGVPTAIRTDSRFLSGLHTDDGFGGDDLTRRTVHRRARAAGISPTGKKWCPQLVPHGDPMSPEGLVSDMHEAEARCRQNGYGASGRINTNKRELDEHDPLEKPYRINDAVVEQKVQERIAREGPVSPKKREQLTGDIRESMMPATPDVSAFLPS